MKKTQLGMGTLVLMLAGTSMIIGDLLIQRDRPDWYEVGLGLLFLAMLSVNHQLGQPESNATVQAQPHTRPTSASPPRD